MLGVRPTVWLGVVWYGQRSRETLAGNSFLEGRVVRTFGGSHRQRDP